MKSRNVRYHICAALTSYIIDKMHSMSLNILHVHYRRCEEFYPSSDKREMRREWHWYHCVKRTVGSRNACSSSFLLDRRPWASDSRMLINSADANYRPLFFCFRAREAQRQPAARVSTLQIQHSSKTTE